MPQGIALLLPTSHPAPLPQASGWIASPCRKLVSPGPARSRGHHIFDRLSHYRPRAAIRDMRFFTVDVDLGRSSVINHPNQDSAKNIGVCPPSLPTPSSRTGALFLP